jgi:ribosomal protein L37AE/L43A
MFIHTVGKPKCAECLSTDYVLVRRERSGYLRCRLCGNEQWIYTMPPRKPITKLPEKETVYRRNPKGLW